MLSERGFLRFLSDCEASRVLLAKISHLRFFLGGLLSVWSLLRDGVLSPWRSVALVAFSLSLLSEMEVWEQHPLLVFPNRVIRPFEAEERVIRLVGDFVFLLPIPDREARCVGPDSRSLSCGGGALAEASWMLTDNPDESVLKVSGVLPS
jgi:hypothetical protein